MFRIKLWVNRNRLWLYMRLVRTRLWRYSCIVKSSGKVWKANASCCNRYKGARCWHCLRNKCFGHLWRTGTNSSFYLPCHHHGKSSAVGTAYGCVFVIGLGGYLKCYHPKWFSDREDVGIVLLIIMSVVMKDCGRQDALWTWHFLDKLCHRP